MRSSGLRGVASSVSLRGDRIYYVARSSLGLHPRSLLRCCGAAFHSGGPYLGGIGVGGTLPGMKSSPSPSSSSNHDSSAVLDTLSYKSTTSMYGMKAMQQGSAAAQVGAMSYEEGEGLQLPAGVAGIGVAEGGEGDGDGGGRSVGGMRSWDLEWDPLVHLGVEVMERGSGKAGVGGADEESEREATDVEGEKSGDRNGGAQLSTSAPWVVRFYDEGPRGGAGGEGGASGGEGKGGDDVDGAREEANEGESVQVSPWHAVPTFTLTHVAPYGPLHVVVEVPFDASQRGEERGGSVAVDGEGDSGGTAASSGVSSASDQPPHRRAAFLQLRTPFTPLQPLTVAGECVGLANPPPFALGFVPRSYLSPFRRPFERPLAVVKAEVERDVAARHSGLGGISSPVEGVGADGAGSTPGSVASPQDRSQPPARTLRSAPPASASMRFDPRAAAKASSDTALSSGRSGQEGPLALSSRGGVLRYRVGGGSGTQRGEEEDDDDDDPLMNGARRRRARAVGGAPQGTALQRSTPPVGLPPSSQVPGRDVSLDTHRGESTPSPALRHEAHSGCRSHLPAGGSNSSPTASPVGRSVPHNPSLPSSSGSSISSSPPFLFFGGGGGYSSSSPTIPSVRTPPSVGASSSPASYEEALEALEGWVVMNGSGRPAHAALVSIATAPAPLSSVAGDGEIRQSTGGMAGSGDLDAVQALEVGDCARVFAVGAILVAVPKHTTPPSTDTVGSLLSSSQSDSSGALSGRVYASVESAVGDVGGRGEGGSQTVLPPPWRVQVGGGIGSHPSAATPASDPPARTLPIPSREEVLKLSATHCLDVVYVCCRVGDEALCPLEHVGVVDPRDAYAAAVRDAGGSLRSYVGAVDGGGSNNGERDIRSDGEGGVVVHSESGGTLRHFRPCAPVPAPDVSALAPAVEAVRWWIHDNVEGAVVGPCLSARLASRVLLHSMSRYEALVRKEKEEVEALTGRRWDVGNAAGAGFRGLSLDGLRADVRARKQALRLSSFRLGNLMYLDDGRIVPMS